LNLLGKAQRVSQLLQDFPHPRNLEQDMAPLFGRKEVLLIVKHAMFLSALTPLLHVAKHLVQQCKYGGDGSPLVFVDYVILSVHSSPNPFPLFSAGESGGSPNCGISSSGTGA
jgi:hypothetical protein